MAEPSAWLYEYGQRNVVMNFRKPHFDGCTERPLYTREAIEAEIVAWLRHLNDAVFVPDTWDADDLAAAIEAGEYRSKSDG